MAGVANIIREFFSVKELAAYSGLGERTIRDRINAATNPIPCYRIGGAIRIKRSEFEQWMTQFCRVDNNRLDNLVNEIMTDLGIPSKRNRKPATARKA